jgi:hypothetical protein
MRSLIITVSLSLLASAACVVVPQATPAAAPIQTVASALPPINAEETPELCRSSLPRVNAPALADQIAGRIELASCVADAAFAPLALTDRPESVVVLDEMVGPAFVLLDEAMSRGDAAAKIAALRVKADIYARMGARMIATVPPQNAHRRHDVEVMIEPWQVRARRTHQRIVDIGDAHPELQNDPAARLAILDSERKAATPIAQRD